MTPPIPAAELPAALTELTWPTPPAICPVCDSQQVNHVKHSWGEFITYACFFEVGRDDEVWHLHSVCDNMAAAVAQRRRADDAERDYAVLFKDYNAAAAWLGVLESGDDLEVAAKRLTDNWSDAIQRAEKAEAELIGYKAGVPHVRVRLVDGDGPALEAIAGEIRAKARADALQAERDAAYVRADTEYAARVRLTEKYDELDAERDALAAQVATLIQEIERLKGLTSI